MNDAKFKELDDAPKEKSSSSWLVWCVLVVLAIGIVVVVWLVPLRRTSKGATHETVGTQLTKLQFTPLTGNATPLSLEQLEGKVVLINFWGTWCPPCREEFPHLIALQQSLAREPDFQFVSVSCQAGRPASSSEELANLRTNTLQFLAYHRTDIPTYADARAVSRNAMMADTGFGDFAFPTTVLIDRDGVIRGMWVGYEKGDADDMLTLAQQVLGHS